MIHCALLGSIERFLSVYIEHTAGKFPVWTAPEQLRIISVNQTDKIIDFTNDLSEKAKSLGIRVECDNTNESVGKKIRNSEIMKVPYTVVIGEKELESGILAPRVRGDLLGGEPISVSTDELLNNIVEEVVQRSKTSLLNN